MIKFLFGINFYFIFLIYGFSSFSYAEETLPKPTAEQVFIYTEVVAKNPKTDNKLALEALQKWMDGTLKVSDAERYREALELPQRQSSIKPMGSTEQCMACIASCCFWWGCNPACLGACTLGVCK